MVELAKGWARNEQVGFWSGLRCGVRRSRRGGVAAPVGGGLVCELVVGAAGVSGGVTIETLRERVEGLEERERGCFGACRSG
jgi:hypothetical protein